MSKEDYIYTLSSSLPLLPATLSTDRAHPGPSGGHTELHTAAAGCPHPQTGRLAAASTAEPAGPRGGSECNPRGGDGEHQCAQRE